MLVPILAREIMNEAVETIHPDETVQTAARRMDDADIGSLVVVDGDDLVGIVTEADVVRVVAEGVDPTTVGVSAVMSSPLTTVAASKSVEAVGETMRRAGVTHLPVVDEGDLVGIVTTVELSYYLPKFGQRLDDTATEPSERVREVRADLAYENVDWESEFRGDRANGVEVGEVSVFTKRLTDRDVRSFAEASGDTNRLHLDAAYAAGTRFRQRIAHGILSVGLISAALARLPGLVIYLSQDLTFEGPVAVGERATARCEVVEDLGRGKFRLDTVVVDEEGDRAVSGTATVLVDEMPPLPEAKRAAGAESGE